MQQFYYEQQGEGHNNPQARKIVSVFFIIYFIQNNTIVKKIN